MNDLPPPPPPRRRPPWTAIAFIAGLLLGWLAIGWWLWPVQWANSAPPQLSAAFQEAYLAAVAEGYALTSDLAQVQARLAGWDETAVTNRLALMEQDAADPAAARRLADLRTALGLPQVNVTMLDLILG
ncbi:MAG: hypothetical protein KC425_08300, partial [Anaerolineales bacterium]|nr:hypothetical protein [Anaerolineales bacterium]